MESDSNTDSDGDRVSDGRDRRGRERGVGYEGIVCEGSVE